MNRNSTPTCHCGSGREFSLCCGPLLSGESRALTAEQLMRSRYSAFVLCDEAYLVKTWHPDTRPAEIETTGVQWLGLKVVRVEDGGAGDDRGTVEFVARYKVGGRGHRLHEVSRFARVDGQWYYVDGDFRE